MFEDKYAKDKEYCKIRDNCHYTGEYIGPAHSICNLRYNTPKEIIMIFHNGSNYDYHFIIFLIEKEIKRIGKNAD